MAIRFFDMFAGIGGFRSGLEAVGGFECIGHCEIDKRTNMAYCAIYDTEGEYYCDDARTINPDEMPDFDLLCAGFPCQSFSVAGKRLGFEDTRGTLFFEVARLLASKRPAFFLLENVPGLLSHDGGKTLETIYATLIEMGYHFEWCVHNSRYFGVPQQRRRLYIVGYLDPRCAGQIFPLSGGNAAHLRQLIGGAQGQRVYDPKGVACTQAATSGGWGGKTGLYFIDMNADPVVTDVARYAGRGSDCGNGRKRNACPASFNGSTADKRGAGNRSHKRIGTTEADRTVQAGRVRRNSEVKRSEPANRIGKACGITARTGKAD